LERVIAIDDKTVRGSKDSFHHKTPLHCVHAWSVENGLCLGRLSARKRRRMLEHWQGKAGGEFRLLKWQIIFPVLFENKGASFNRKYFVHSVFKKISAHYNVEMVLLLDYFCNDRQIMGWMSKDLRVIILDLSLQVKRSDDIQPDDNKQVLDVMTDCRERLRVNSAQTIHNIIKDFSEEELYEFAKQFFPSEGEFIIAYVRYLDKLPNTTILQGRAGSGFHKVKWIFIFAALDEMPESNFNQRYFVSETLHGLAACYHLAYFDLLVYFQTEQTALQLLVRLFQVLNELYLQEKTRWVTVALKSGKETDRFRMLAALVPKEQQFVKTYIRSLDFYRTKTVLQGKTSGSFKQVKWKFIFDVLLEIRHIAFNKKQFVSHALQQLAAHYNLSFREILEYVAVLTNLPEKQKFAEIDRIIKELHSDEIVQSSLQTRNKFVSEMIAKLSDGFVRDAGFVLRYLARIIRYIYKYTEKRLMLTS
jgi:hypothetical protein